LIYHAQVTAPSLRFSHKGGEAMDSVIELHLHIYPERKWHITLSNPKSKSQQTFTTLEAFFKHLEQLCPPKQKGLR
jgi:hypothetical protein